MRIHPARGHFVVVVYLALARRRGVACRLLVPEKMSVCMHLKATGVFEELKARGVTIDDRGVAVAKVHKSIGTGEPHKGIGLYAVAEDARLRGGSLLLHSGLGSLEIREDRESEARRTRLFPGTLGYLAIPA